MVWANFWSKACFVGCHGDGLLPCGVISAFIAIDMVNSTFLLANLRLNIPRCSDVAAKAEHTRDTPIHDIVARQRRPAGTLDPSAGDRVAMTHEAYR